MEKKMQKAFEIFFASIDTITWKFSFYAAYITQVQFNTTLLTTNFLP